MFLSLVSKAWEGRSSSYSTRTSDELSGVSITLPVYVYTNPSAEMYHNWQADLPKMYINLTPSLTQV